LHQTQILAVNSSKQVAIKSLAPLHKLQLAVEMVVEGM
jgi:hypothetical protein